MDAKDKTTLAVVGIVGFSLMGCCSLLLAVGALGAWQDAVDARASAPAPTPAPDSIDPVADPPPPVDQFARALTAELTDAGHPGFRFDPDGESLIGDGGTISLTNLYEEWADLPATRRPAFVRDTAAGLMPPPVPETWEAAKPNVLVTVRDRVFVELLKLDQEGTTLVFRPLADELVEVAVWDTTHAMQYLNHDTLKDWGVTADQVFAHGRAQLLARSDAKFEELSPGLYESAWRDNHDVGRATLPEVLRRPKVKGDPVVFLPQRDHLLIAGSDDVEALANAAVQIDEYLELPRSMSGRGWRLTPKDTFEPFVVKPSDLELATHAELRREADARDANEQKTSLDKKFARDGVDVFVGSTLFLEDDDGSQRTYAVWTKGSDSLLPKADFLVFMDLDRPEGEQLVAAVEWKKATALLKGELHPDPRFWPPRYRARHFPEPKLVRALGRHPLFTREE